MDSNARTLVQFGKECDVRSRVEKQAAAAATRVAANADAVSKVAAATASLSPQAQIEAIGSTVIPAPDQPTSNRLWFIIIPGLIFLAVLLATLAFVLELLKKSLTTDPSLLIPPLTFVLGAFVGLFAKSPVETGGGKTGSGTSAPPNG